MSDLNRAISLNPQSPLAFSNRAVLWDKKGDLAKSTSDLVKAAQLEPRLPADAPRTQGFNVGE